MGADFGKKILKFHGLSQEGQEGFKSCHVKEIGIIFNGKLCLFSEVLHGDQT